MKLRLLHTFFCLFFTFLSLFAQEISVSPAMDFSTRSEHVKVLGKHGDLTYVHIFDNNDHQIAAYFSSLRLKWKKSIPFNNRDGRFEALLFHKGKMIFFYSEREKQSRILYGKTIDQEGVVDANSIIALDTIQKDIAESFPQVAFEESQNKQGIVAYWIDKNTFENNYFHYLIFDRTLKIKNKGEIKLPFTQKRTEFHSVVITNKAQLYVVVAEYRTKQMENAKRFWVMTSYNDFQDFEHMEVATEENIYLNNVKFKVDDLNETITVVGFYDEGHSGTTGAEGIYFARIPFHSSTPLITSYEPFQPDFIARIKGTKRNRNNNKLYSFIIDKVVLRQDGGVLFVAESFYKTYRSSSYLYDIYGFPSQNESTVIYHFDELIVASLHPSGKIHWKNVVIKNQSSNGDYGRYSSYQMMNSGLFLKFVFNEKISSRTNLIEYTMDVNGNMNRSVVLNSRNYDIYLMPQFGEQLSADKIVIPSLKKGEMQLVQLDYKLE